MTTPFVGNCQVNTISINQRALSRLLYLSPFLIFPSCRLGAGDGFNLDAIHPLQTAGQLWRRGGRSPR